MRSRWFGFVVAALAAALSLWAYPRLPESVATHWNLHGQPDDYSSRLFAAFGVPLVIVGIAGLFQVLPKLDPRQANYPKFLGTYWLIANAVILFMAGVHALIIASGLGANISVTRVIPLGVAVLLVVLGNYLTRVEPNWFVGIRTPWTLSSDAVWRKTHRTAGWVFVAGGLVMAAATFGPKGFVGPALVAVFATAVLVPVVQSYILWKREQGGRR